MGAPQVLISKITRASGLTNGDVPSYFAFRVKRATNNFLRPHPLLLRRLGVVGQPKFHGQIRPVCSYRKLSPSSFLPGRPLEAREFVGRGSDPAAEASRLRQKKAPH